jgi:nucleotide-binding universal stress UspA family protein
MSKPAVSGPKPSQGWIVVGIDGSELSQAALRWAAQEAHRRGVGLQVVTCWSYPMMPWGPYQPPLSSQDFDAQARELAEREVDEVLGPDRGSLDVQIATLQGAASLRLLDYDGAADMIVVGSRGRGGFAGLLLGSVGQHLAEHARCPVVIIRPQ